MTFQGTGIQFNSDPEVVKGAIALLKQRNPRTKVGKARLAGPGGWLGREGRRGRGRGPPIASCSPPLARRPRAAPPC